MKYFLVEIVCSRSGDYWGIDGSIQPTGLPLPFISAGSSSLVVFMSAIGVLNNISKQSQ